MAAQSVLSELEAFADARVQSGQYSDRSDVLRAAMHALERVEAGDETEEEWLIRAAEEGEASGVAEGEVIARVRERVGLPTRVTI